LETIDSVIATLNQLGLGSIDKIANQLASVRSELERRELPDLVRKIDDCQLALSRGDLEGFRRLRETVVSRLGHLRTKLD
jgi:hypothetical protein